MSFDIEGTIGDMAAAISGIISDEWSGVEACVKKSLDDEKDSLANNTKARIDNEIDDEDLKSHLEDEKVVLEAALLACKVKAKILVQNAANSAMDVLKEAIKVAI